MPLTKKGKNILKDFQKQYGDKKGKSYFYAYMEKFPKFARSWHKQDDKIQWLN